MRKTTRTRSDVKGDPKRKITPSRGWCSLVGSNGPHTEPDTEQRVRKDDQGKGKKGMLPSELMTK